MEMRYVFFGTPRFAEIVLSGLMSAGMPPIAVVCNPDRPVGRKHIITSPPTKLIALKGSSDIDILQPDALDEAFVKRIAELEPDFFVVAAYAKIIPPSVLAVPRLGTLGTHPSLLPAYRGASPIQSVILAGETITGSTIYQMDEKMDHGRIFIQETMALDPLSTDYVTLEHRLATLSASLLTKIIPQLIEGTAHATVQDESRATFTKKFTTENGFVEYSELDAARSGNSDKSETILRAINAFTPEPGCWTLKEGKRIKLIKAEMDNGALRLLQIQHEGQRPTDVISGL